MSAQKLIRLCGQERNHGRAGEEVGKALWKKVTERAFSGGNRIRKSGARGPPIDKCSQNKPREEGGAALSYYITICKGSFIGELQFKVLEGPSAGSNLHLDWER